MGNPTTACTVQVPMTLSKRRHRQSLSLQLEQVGQLGSINTCEKKKSASLESSPRVTEEKSIASFLSGKQVPSRKPSSLSGSEDYVEGTDLTRGISTTEDKKTTSFNPFRGHRRAGSGSIISSCKSLESTPRGKGGSLSFRKEAGGSSSFRKEGGGSLSFRKEGGGSSFRKEGGGSFRKEAGGSSFRREGGGSSFRTEGGGSSFRKEGGGSSFRKDGGGSSFRKDKSAIAKIAASLFHSPTKLERSMSMSRLAQKAIPEEVVSLRQKFQRSSDDIFPQTTELGGDKESGSDTLVKDMEESSARPMISNTSSQQHESVIGIKNRLNGQGEGEFFSTTAINDSQPFSGDASGLPSVGSEVFVNAAERVSSNLSEASLIGTSNDDLLHSDYNPYGWTKNFSLSNVTRTSALPSSSEKYCSPLALSECNSESSTEASPKEPPSIGSQSSRLAWVDEDQPCTFLETSILSSTGGHSLGSFHSETEKISLPIEADISEENLEKGIAADDLQSLLFVTEKVTEEELTEAAVLSSLMSEEYLTSPVFMLSEKSQQNLLTSPLEKHTPIFSPSTRSETGLTRSPCNSDACLKKCMSFEPVARDKSKAESDRKAAKLRKRRRSVSASGIGAMLLKVVRVSDSGPIITRRLPKVGPEVISGADALRAREYVLQKTAQISMGRASESSSPASSRLAACQCESENTVKLTHPKFVDAENGPEDDCVELVQHSKEAREGVDGTGCEEDSTCENRHQNQRTILERHVEVIPGHLPDSENTNSGISDCRREATAPTVPGKVERVNSNLQRQIKSALVSASANTQLAGLAENVDERSGGKPKKKSCSRGRSNSYNFDTLTECPQMENSKQAALSILDANVAISRERSRSFVSRLQAPSAMASVDIFRLAPSSISILANPSFSSSHQDRLWEEQAEAYSSGGRGTPGREDEPAAANVFLHSPSPGAPISSDDHQVPSASASLRRGLIDSSAGTASSLSGDKGRHKKKGQGKKRGRPHTPLRSLLADDLHSKSSGSTTRASPEGGHFLQHIMSRIRGSSSKSLSSKSPDTTSKRRNTWSSCICFSSK
ncbi:hypothetical protein M758_2G223900 [Ceratodon purpureus]|nr:hypothetical protein M758_2G223900 [Ceratodon purpureus]KAG0627731.1 hypothetical protein M758_2G223900 [Ceratodon purpureus]